VITGISSHYGAHRWAIPLLVFLSVVINIDVHWRIGREEESLGWVSWIKAFGAITFSR
jgi:hypothetical protein